MKKFLTTTALLLAFLIGSAQVYCDDCWQAGYQTNQGVVTINWTFTGGDEKGSCWNSYHSNNMYPWSTAYIYLDNVLVDVVYYSNSENVRCDNYA